MRIALVEDNVAVQKSVREFLERSSVPNEVVFISDNVNTSIENFNTYQIDLAILDIEIIDGLIFDVLTKIKKINFNILFFSSQESHAIAAFKFSALNYIVKPLIFEELEIEILKVQNKIHSKNEISILKHQVKHLEEILINNKVDKIALPSSQGVDFIDFNQLAWIEADANYCTFHLKNKSKYIVSKPLKEYSIILEGKGFYRIHKSYLVNISYVKMFSKENGGMVILENDTEILVSRRKKEGLLETLL